MMCTDVYESALWGIEFCSTGITWNMNRGGTVPSTKGISLLEAGCSVFLLEVNCCLSVEVHQGHVAQRGFSWDFVLSYLRWLHGTVNRMWTYLNCFLSVHFAKPYVDGAPWLHTLATYVDKFYGKRIKNWHVLINSTDADSGLHLSFGNWQMCSVCVCILDW